MDVLAPSPETAAEPGAVRADRLHWLGPAAVMLGLGLLGVGRPQPWRDELVTATVARRSVPQIWHLVHHVDAVIAPYYFVEKAWAAVFGAATVSLRMPSVLAMAVAAGVTAAIAGRLAGPRAGWLAGLVFAAVPAASRFAQEARPYALATATAAVATLLLVDQLDRPARIRWVGYAVALAATGALHLIALSVVAAHAVAVGWGFRSRRRLVGWWLGAVALAVAACAPLALAGRRQHWQVAWIPRTTPGALRDDLTMLTQPGVTHAGMWFTGVLLALGVVGLVVRWRVAVVPGALAVVPLALVALIGTHKAIFFPRYLTFTLVGWAVLGGLALARVRGARVGPPVAVAGLLVVVGLAVPGQLDNRRPYGHLDGGVPEAAARIAHGYRPGDAIAYAPGEYWLRLGLDIDLPADRRPADVLVLRTAAANDSYNATECFTAACLGTPARVWIVCARMPADPTACLAAPIAAAIRAAYAVTPPHTAGTVSVALATRD